VIDQLLLDCPSERAMKGAAPHVFHGVAAIHGINVLLDVVGLDFLDAQGTDGFRERLEKSEVQFLCTRLPVRVVPCEELIKNGDNSAIPDLLNVARHEFRGTSCRLPFCRVRNCGVRR
jgi:hypothetical protein